MASLSKLVKFPQLCFVSEKLCNQFPGIFKYLQGVLFQMSKKENINIITEVFQRGTAFDIHIIYFQTWLKPSLHSL